MPSSKPQKLLAIVQRGFEEVWNQGHLAALDELLAPDFRAHDPTVPTGYVSRDAVRGVLEQIRAAFPDVRREVCDYVAQGNKIAVRWQVTGTHRGPFAGVPATGRQVKVTGITFYRFAGNRISEEWVETDAGSLTRQLTAT